MMKRISIFLTLSLFTTLPLLSQTPSNIIINGRTGQPNPTRSLLMCNEAGTYQFGASFGQSNDFTPDSIYLCFGDSLQVIHERDFDFSGDPVPASTPGIGYAFYDDIPTIEGPDLATIQTDPSLNRTDPIFVGGFPEPQTNGIWIARGNVDGDITLRNLGGLQNAYNNGDPVAFWFAPITIDDFSGANGLPEYENDGMGGPTGPCVDVNINAAIYVVYLNTIQATNINSNAGGNGCIASFDIAGGLPQFEAGSNYDITIGLVGDPSVQGTIISGTPNHGETVEFFVPESGNYRVTIEDGKSCGTEFTVAMTACQPVEFEFPVVSALPNTPVCVDLNVNNFNNVSSVQFTITWDPTILEYTGIENINTNLPNLNATPDNFNPNPAAGTLTFAWFNLTGINLPDGSSMFQVCFNAIGNLGDFGPVGFSDTPTPTEIIDANSDQLGFNFTAGGVSINNGLTVNANLTQDSVSCAGLADGAFTIAPTGGTGPYTVTWDTIPVGGAGSGNINIANEGDVFTVSNVPAGSYQVTIQDSGTPVFTTIDTIEVLQGPLLGANINTMSPTCFGGSDGSVTAVVILDAVEQPNPGPAYSFTWNIPGETGQSITGIPGGFYAVTISDQNNCTAEASLTLTSPAQIALSSNINNASCSGAANGSISVTPSNGTTADGNYTFNWSEGLIISASTSTLSDLMPGDYTVTVTDDNNCERIETFTVGTEKTLSVDAGVTQVNCNGACDGQIFVQGVTSGAAADLPYTFQWEGTVPLNTVPVNTDETSTLTDLCPGTYTLTMTDSDPEGCEIVVNFNVTEPDPIEITEVSTTDETCEVGMDGSAIIAVTGGTLPYAFAWPNETSDSIITNLGAGDYTVTLTDGNNCVDSLEVRINAPLGPSVLQLDDVSLPCSSDMNGSLVVTASQGNTPIENYNWSNGAVGTFITDLSPGVYVVTITDEAGCSTVDSAFVLAPPALVIDSLPAISPTCAGSSDGSITVFASGGTEPYEYVWDNEPENDTLEFVVYPALTAGDYQVSVYDANGCPPVIGNQTVVDPPAIQVAFANIDSVSCFGDVICDGQATASAEYEGGITGIFNFTWESSEMASNTDISAASQLCSGFQMVTVTDEDGICGVVDSVLIPSPPEITVAVETEPVSCNNEGDGSITLTVSGGTPDYSFVWTGGANSVTNVATDLPAGNYSILITDENNCTQQQQVTVNEPDGLVALLIPESSFDAQCNGLANGSFGVTYNFNDDVNPLGPNPYTWSNNIATSSDSIATDLAAGTYAVTITDINGCQDSISFTVTEPEPLVAIIPDPEDPACFNEPTFIIIDTIFGGNGNSFLDYSYEVDNNQLRLPPDQPFSVFAGVHTIIVRDSLDCSEEYTVDISQPNPILIDLESEIEVELGDSTSQLDPIVTADLPIASYNWTPGLFLSSDTVQSPLLVSPLESTNYAFTVVDINGCTASANIFVEIDRNRNVFIPNVFSPNGDGLNDEFRIHTCTGVGEISKVVIFDRWGDLVAEENNLSPNCDGVIVWDGRLDGELLNSNVYVYLIEVIFVDGRSLVYRGDVTLLR